MNVEGVTMMESPGNRNKWRWNTGTRLIAGLVAGAGLGFVVGKALKHGHPGVQADGADIAAIGLAAFYIGATALLLWIANDRMRLARVLEGKGADIPASDDEVRSFIYQALVMGLAGILLALPVFGARFLADNLLHRQISFGGIVLLFAVQTYFNVRLWRVSDEFVRSTMAKTAALTFAIGQGGLFLRAAAERMSLLKPASSWDLLVIMMQLYIFVGLFVSVRTLDRSSK